MFDAPQLRPLLPCIPDDSHHTLSESFGVPVRRDFALPALSIPSGSLLLIDPSEKAGMIIDCGTSVVQITPQIWTLDSGEMLLGTLSLQFPKPKVSSDPITPEMEQLLLVLGIPELPHVVPQNRRKIKKMGRVTVTSGVLALTDAALWEEHHASLPRDILSQQIQEHLFLEATWGEERLLLVRPGYGVGQFAAVAAFDQEVLNNVMLFLLKGGTP